MSDILKIAGKEIKNRLFIGTGKFPDKAIIKDVLVQSKADVVTVALRRVDQDSKKIISLIIFQKIALS